MNTEKDSWKRSEVYCEYGGGFVYYLLCLAFLRLRDAMIQILGLDLYGDA
jgi:hypothetical protein